MGGIERGGVEAGSARGGRGVRSCCGNRDITISFVVLSLGTLESSGYNKKVMYNMEVE